MFDRLTRSQRRRRAAVAVGSGLNNGCVLTDHVQYREPLVSAPKVHARAANYCSRSSFTKHELFCGNPQLEGPPRQVMIVFNYRVHSIIAIRHGEDVEESGEGRCAIRLS